MLNIAFTFFRKKTQLLYVCMEVYTCIYCISIHYHAVFLLFIFSVRLWGILQFCGFKSLQIMGANFKYLFCFQGAMKRHGFKGMPASHGASLSHRSIGGTGNRTGRVSCALLDWYVCLVPCKVIKLESLRRLVMSELHKLNL